MSDNGIGFDADREGDGPGLASLRERARSIGGQLELLSKVDHGTTVSLSVPLDTAEPDQAPV